MIKLNSHKYSNKYNGKDASLLFKIGWSHNIKRLSFIFNGTHSY